MADLEYGPARARKPKFVSEIQFGESAMLTRWPFTFPAIIPSSLLNVTTMVVYAEEADDYYEDEEDDYYEEDEPPPPPPPSGGGWRSAFSVQGGEEGVSLSLIEMIPWLPSPTMDSFGVRAASRTSFVCGRGGFRV